MKFQLFSDIHLELTKSYLKIPILSEYLILAGDIGSIKNQNFKDFITYCSLNYKKVIYIFGNHEFYSKHNIDTVKEQFKDFFNKFDNIFLLDNSPIVIEDITIYGFIGFTSPIFSQTHIAKNYLNDYNQIRTKNGLFTISNHNEIVKYETDKFKEFILSTDSNKVLIISHFPPVKNTSDSKYKDSILSNYFTWNNYLKLNNIKTDKIKCWISGHTHYSYDFIEEDIRYISNQIGYTNEETGFNNGLFEI